MKPLVIMKQSDSIYNIVIRDKELARIFKNINDFGYAFINNTNAMLVRRLGRYLAFLRRINGLFIGWDKMKKISIIAINRDVVDILNANKEAGQYLIKINKGKTI